MENKLKVRDSSLDVVRIAAVLSVLGIHFFLYTGFYVNPVEGPVFYLMCLIRTLDRKSVV